MALSKEQVVGSCVTSSYYQQYGNNETSDHMGESLSYYVSGYVIIKVVAMEL
jgi:hypothetical protein